MEILKKDTENYILNVEIKVDKAEFDDARHKAYLDNTDIYPVIDQAPGLATLPALERTYGPAVLYDEALGILIPETFNKFLSDEGIRIMGKPQVDNMEFTPEGGVKFTVKADMFPEVELGKYKGIAVPFRRSEQQMEFEQAVVQKACENMKGEIPPHMIEQKINAIAAQTKININNDAVYHLLSDMLVLVDEAYKAAGAYRPKVQVRREAMDLMLQTASAEHESDWKEFFRAQIRDMAERYHDLPDDFDAQVDKILADRDKKKAEMTPDERTEELFKTYLGSLELSEEQWRNQTATQAAKDVCLDLLLDAVSEKENIEVGADEVHQFIEEIAASCNMEPEEAEANINKDPLIWKLKRDKALALVLNSAVTDEEGKKKLDEKRKEAMEKAKAETTEIIQ